MLYIIVITPIVSLYIYGGRRLFITCLPSFFSQYPGISLTIFSCVWKSSVCTSLYIYIYTGAIYNTKFFAASVGENWKNILKAPHKITYTKPTSAIELVWTMSAPKQTLYQRYLALPKRLRVYLGVSTFIVAFAGDRITRKIEDDNALRAEAEQRLAMENSTEN